MKKKVVTILFIFLFIAVGFGIIPKFFSKYLMASLSCFPAGTKVTMADNTAKNIEDVKVGDRVLSQSVSGATSVSTVKGLDRPIRDHMCQINFKDGESLKLTQEHPILTTTGWKAIEPNTAAYDDPNLVVGTLKRGDGVIRLDNVPDKVTSFTCWPQKVQTYNLMLHGTVNTYFVGGFLAHNRVSPDANNNKKDRDLARGYGTPAEYAALAGGATIAEIVAAEAEINHQLERGYAESPQGQALIGGFKSALTKNAAIFGALGGATNLGDSPQNYPGGISAYVNNLFDALVSGGGLTADQVSVYLGNTIGPVSDVVNDPIKGWYKVEGYAGDVLFKEKFYPIGTGPNKEAKDTDVVNPSGTIMPPPPPGSIKARAVTMTTIPTTCDQILAEDTCRDNTLFTLNGPWGYTQNKTQDACTYVKWDGLRAGYAHTLVPRGVGTNSIHACLTDPSGGKNFDEFSFTVESSKSATFDVAYGPLPPWFQVQGGDVYGGLGLHSVVPPNASPQLFMLDGTGTGGYPGVVTYGGGVDFSADAGANGDDLVSSKKWLANFKVADRDFYGYFFSKLGSPSDITPHMPTPLTEPPYSAPTPNPPVYYLKGDVTTFGDWKITSGQKYVFLIDGTLTIGGNINITGNGFIAFIVRGNISVAPSVGGAHDSTDPVVEGVYISSGTIRTGVGEVGKERFVGRGMFIANDVRLQRTLGVSLNKTYAAELFMYNPSLFMNMPEAMKYEPVSWQEVAP